jgi:hypothetical protein
MSVIPVTAVAWRWMPGINPLFAGVERGRHTSLPVVTGGVDNLVDSAAIDPQSCSHWG